MNRPDEDAFGGGMRDVSEDSKDVHRGVRLQDNMPGRSLLV